METLDGRTRARTGLGGVTAMLATLDTLDAERFLSREARLLDAADYRAWLDLTTDDVVYWVPVNDAEASPDEHLSIVYDDRRRLETRIWRILDSGLNHAQDPRSSTLRFVTNVEVEAAEAPGEVFVRANVLLYEYRAGAQRRNVTPNAHPARCEYRLRNVDGAWKIAYKKIVLLTLDGLLPTMTYLI
jgi:3-phenylpropionate/cinnamic acid dioxygenase small subunit